MGTSQHTIGHQCLPLLEPHVQKTYVYQREHQMETWHVQWCYIWSWGWSQLISSPSLVVFKTLYTQQPPMPRMHAQQQLGLHQSVAGKWKMPTPPQALQLKQKPWLEHLQWPVGPKTYPTTNWKTWSTKQTDKSLLNLDKHFIKEKVMERTQVHYMIGTNYNTKHMLSKSPNPFNDCIPTTMCLPWAMTQPHRSKRRKTQSEEKENETNKEKTDLWRNGSQNSPKPYSLSRK